MSKFYYKDKLVITQEELEKIIKVLKGGTDIPGGPGWKLNRYGRVEDRKLLPIGTLISIPRGTYGSDHDVPSLKVSNDQFVELTTQRTLQFHHMSEENIVIKFLDLKEYDIKG